MPVEFLTDEQAASYGKVNEELTRPELERFFFLDDEDRTLIAKRRAVITTGSGSPFSCAPCATSAGSSRTTRWTFRGRWCSTSGSSSASRTSRV
ncbi:MULTISPECIES: DUF4158 domain-containing protein [Actinoalloteichus]|uniref:DUF4158 domain-containing protein n=1 Tax=Actinoalloteichus TaxID=65496 RepID=UPI001E4EA246|nr:MULTISPECIES: DUF4158 domain-containing protein [Actinoalloteichus]